MMKKGLDPIIGILLVSIAIITSASIIGRHMRSEIKSMQMMSSFRRGAEAMKNIRDSINELASEGGSRILDIELTDGSITFSAGDNEVYYSVPAGYSIMPSGYRREEDGLIFTSGSDVDVSVSGNTITANNGVIEANFSKIGSESSPGQIDAREILKSITYLETGKTINPNLDILIGGKNQTFGTGYIYAVSTGAGLNSARIVAKVSSKDFNFTAIYIIPSGADYVKVKIRDIKQNS